MSVVILFFTYACIRSGNARKAVFSYRSLPHWGRGTAQRRSGALVNDALETISPDLFHTASTLSGSLRSPPSPHGEGFVSGILLFPSNLRPFGAPPSIGRRECPRESLPLEGAAERSEAGLASFFAAKPPPLCLPHAGKGGVILVPSSTTSIALTRASQRGAGSILRLFDWHAFSGGNPLHLFSNVLPHRRRGQDRPARGIPLCGYSL